MGTRELGIRELGLRIRLLREGFAAALFCPMVGGTALHGLDVLSLHLIQRNKLKYS